MFSLAQKLEMDCCHRCGIRIESVEVFSIEHKSEWQRAADPVSTFFDLENIAFSHLLCNIRAGYKPYKRFSSKKECDAFNDKKNRTKKIASKQGWRDRQRAAGLPYC